MEWTADHFSDTARAFDSVAADYDGPGGNNALIQGMRAALWQAVTQALPGGGQLLDLGCGTGIDAEYFARRGYSVCATDWSPKMVERTRQRVPGDGPNIRVEHLGIQELERLQAEPFDGVYSDLGPLNCIADLRAAARACAALLKPKGLFVASVIGRNCPWEFFYYALQGKMARARVRAANESVPVNLNSQTVWTRYYSPREFYGAFAAEFELITYRALNLFLPPPYFIRWYERAFPLFAPLAFLDSALGALPPFRDAGDHFLIVLRKRE